MFSCKQILYPRGQQRVTIPSNTQRVHRRNSSKLSARMFRWQTTTMTADYILRDIISRRA